MLPPRTSAYPLTSSNSYLDRYRDKKELNKYALLERLKTVDPFDYKKQFEIDPLPNAYGIPKDKPSWMWSSIWKKRNRYGNWRPMRPASALIAHNNNADLDSPKWPLPTRIEIAQRYPDSTRRPKPLRETKWGIPVHEHQTYRVDHVDQFKEIEEEEKKKQ